jgi:hypothetical protein
MNFISSNELDLRKRDVALFVTSKWLVYGSISLRQTSFHRKLNVIVLVVLHKERTLAKVTYYKLYAIRQN